ncbi:MAG: N-6 DNA methylase [Candidatus Azambacteria bacterium]|nr:N-6 DNA methylase [Candidatus Azambacteria bacterium]
MNTDTKRHIDAARQVLVGVVPNPTSQIDQITYALIYKFMDDMDQAAIKNGDEPAFFIGDLEQYSWARIMDSRIGNQDRMNLYVVAFQKFAEAKQLPELFRNILKSAFLPYRSPETLGLFLKEINYFDYSHPEELGNAYEYLLSIMSSQGDAGQFRTPRHIIDFIVDVVNPAKNDKVLDPACGTSGFLVSSYTHILEQHDGKDDAMKKEKPLTPDERKKLMANFEGYDIDPTMVRIAQVNMYLHQFKNPKIFQYDSLSSEERWNDKFDVILANPPFMSPKGGIKPHSKFSIQSSRSEVLFVDYIMNHLRPKGRAGIIVPEGIIFQSGTAHKQLRKNLVEDGLYAVVSLPSGVFAPYSGVKTSILLFNNELAKTSQEILFVKIEQDGFDLGATKRPISKNDLPTALEILNKWNTGKKVENKLAVYIEKSKIAESGDYNLSGDHYRVATDYSNAKWPMTELGEVTEILNGYAFKSEKYTNSGIRVIRITNVQKGEIVDNDPKFYAIDSSKEIEKFLLAKNDLLISLTGNVGRVGLLQSDLLPAGLNQRVGCVRLIDNKKISINYLFHVLNTDLFEDDCIRASSGVAQKNLSTEWLKKYQIPLPPLEIQEQIVAELEGYASIIAGARQIVKNWKSKIDINPEWKKVKIGELVKNKIIDKPLDGNHGEIHPKASDYVQEGIPFIMANDLLDGIVDIKNCKKITEKQAKGLRKGFAENDDVLLTHKGTIGRTAILNSEYNYVVLTPQVTYYRVLDKGKLLNRFLKVYFDSDIFQDRLQQLASIGATRAYIGITDQLNLEVVVPPLEIQEQIVQKIEAERALVESAKKLIDIYDQKTKEVIAKLWVTN